MPDILPTINNEPPQGIQALLDTVYLWNPDVANDLIEKINELLRSIDNVSGKIPPYSELEAPILQYMPCYDGDNVYVAAQDLDELPGTLNPSQWILIATRAPVLQAGTGISIDGNEISVTQAISDGAAAGSTAVQPGDLGTAAYAATTDFATAAQGSLADSAVQPEDLGTAAYASTSDFATAAQGGKADTAVQPGDLGTAAYAATTDFATAAQGQLADSAIQASDLGTAAYAASTDFATAAQGAKADTAIQSVKTINGNDIVGTGNLVITSFAVYPASWPTTGTTKAFCDAIAADDTAVEGMTYLGEVTLTDMPNGIANSEIQVEIMSGSSAYNKIILLTLTSGNVAPYRWQYTYWNAGTNVSGWINIGQQVNVDWNSSSGVTQILNKPAIPTVVDDYNSTSGTAALSANMGHDLNERLTSVEGRGRFLSTWNCATGLAGTNPPTSPYTYKSGDYFIVSTVGATNYKPTGSQYVTGTASSVVETGSVAVNDTYQYDGSNWVLLKNTVEDPLPSQTGNNGKYLTTDGTAASWAAISFPVSSVNSQTGTVTLTATDVGALPSSTVIPSTAIDVNAVPQLSTLPTADLAHEGQVVQFVGVTGTYTNGYFYKCVSDGDVSNPTFSWVRVDVQPTPVIPDPLPSQTGNSGKFLTTDGTDASWATVPAGQVIQVDTIPTADATQVGRIVQYVGTTSGNDVYGLFYKCYEYSSNYYWSIIDVVPDYHVRSTNNSTYAIIGKYQTGGGFTHATGVGYNIKVYNYGVALGSSAVAHQYAVGIGYNANVTTNYGVGIGYNTSATHPYATCVGVSSSAQAEYSSCFGNASGATGQYATALGYSAKANAQWAIQIGGGTNTTASTVQFYSHRMLDVNTGFIPADRLANAINKYSTMPTAASTNEGWIVQYIGTTDSTYTHGYIYECVSDNDPTNPTYSWSAVSVQAGGGSSLPSQSGNSGKFLTTDGTDASWADIPTELPTQSGNSGKYLTTNGTAVSWAAVESLPSQSGQSGKYLTTNGTTASWATVETLPSQSGNSGKLLTTNGTAASWDTKANLGLSGVTLRTWGANE